MITMVIRAGAGARWQIRYIRRKRTDYSLQAIVYAANY